MLTIKDLLWRRGWDSHCLAARSAADSPRPSLSAERDERRVMAERVGFEPTCRFRDNTLSRRARYDHFGTSPLGKTATVAGTSNYTKRPPVSR